MRYCNQCGAELSESAVFCPMCGTPVARRAEEPIAYEPPAPEEPFGFDAPEPEPFAYEEPQPEQTLYEYDAPAPEEYEFDAPLPAEELPADAGGPEKKPINWKILAIAGAAIVVLIVGGILIAHFLHKAAEDKKAEAERIAMAAAFGKAKPRSKSDPRSADPSGKGTEFPEDGAYLDASYTDPSGIFGTIQFNRDGTYYLGGGLDGALESLEDNEAYSSGTYTVGANGNVYLAEQEIWLRYDSEKDEYILSLLGEELALIRTDVKLNLVYLTEKEAREAAAADKKKLNEAAQTAYQEILRQYQGACALKSWTGSEAQLSQYPYVNSYMMTEYSNEYNSRFFYAYPDINNDGVAELLIGRTLGNSGYEPMPISLFSFHKGKPVRVIDDSSFNWGHAEIFRDGTIHEWRTDGARVTDNYYWQIADDGSPRMLNSYSGDGAVVSPSEYSWSTLADIKAQENIVGTWILYESRNKNVPLGEDVTKYGAILYLTNRDQILYFVGNEWKTGTYTYSGATVTASLKQYDSPDSSRSIGTETLRVTWVDEELTIESDYNGYTLRWNRSGTGNPTLPTYESVYPTDLSIRNDLSTRILGLYITPSTSTGWGSPVNRDAIARGGTLKLDRSVLTAGSASYDIGAVGEDKREYLVFNVPLSVGAAIAFTADGSTATVTVNGVKYTGTVNDPATRYVTVQNSLPTQIHSIYISPPSNSEWGTPVNSSRVNAGASVQIDSSVLVNGNGTYDIAVVDANNWNYDIYNVPINAGDTIVISASGETAYAVIGSARYTGIAYDGNKANESPEPTQSASPQPSPSPVEPSPEPSPVEPTPVEPTPTDPAPTEPVPTDPGGETSPEESPAAG